MTVGEVNTAPVLDSIGPQGVTMPGTLTFTATATDGDVITGDNDTMRFSMTGAPAGASMDSLTGTFSWTPAESQAGTYTMTVRVEDGSGASDSEAVTVTATGGGTNEAPVLDFIGPQEINELGTLEFTATATDNDGDSLTFTMAGDRLRGASMTPGGMFSWTPDQSQDGDYSITVRVSDGRGGTDSEVVTVTVHDIAPLPVSARASSSSAIALTLSEAVTDSEGQEPNGFSVTTGGDPVSVESITGSGTTTLVLGLNGTISASDGAVRLSYSDDGRRRSRRERQSRLHRFRILRSCSPRSAGEARHRLQSTLARWHTRDLSISRHTSQNRSHCMTARARWSPSYLTAHLTFHL